ncbi:tyrosine-type recombinase/integrase [Lysobacter sp. CCNWLW3]|uniref:tyrosine-type recombinase/integrase n=1 Tax=unclassified Lysobacter TaxID=2635362 RepID=UPI002FD0D9FC
MDDRTIGDLATERRILEAFDTLARGKRTLVAGTKRARTSSEAYDSPTVTTAELTFRWVSRATDYCMTRERRVAANAGRPPSLQINPLHVLRDEGRYRTRKQLEEHYEAAGVRNPLQLRDGSLGRFLEALWTKRKVPNYRTACDYLLLTLLWGTRRGEAAPLRWRHRITKEEASICSWADLEAGWVSFFDTKNGTTHTLPLAPAARRILELREEASREGKTPWVFPARSSKAAQGHYLDSKAILQGLKKAGEIEELRTHDLRRTFATVAEEMTSYAVVKRLLNHHDLRDVTGRYARVDGARLSEELIRVERMMLQSAPFVATALL